MFAVIAKWELRHRGRVVILNALSECFKAGENVGVLVAIRELGNSEGHKIRFPDRSLSQYPWGMHICDIEEENARGIPRNYVSRNALYRIM